MPISTISQKGLDDPLTLTSLAVTGQASLGTGQTDYIAAIGGGGTARVEAVGGNTNINLSLSTKGTGATYFWRGGYGGTASMLIDGSGNVGIGTTTPATKLNIADIGTGVALQFNGYTGGQNIQAKIECERPNFNNFESQLRFYTHNGSSLAEKMRINQSGQVITGSSITGGTPQGDLNVIGATSTKTEFYMLKAGQVEGHIGFIAGTNDNWYFNTGPSLGTYGLYQANNSTSWFANSDERLKTDLVPIENGLKKVAALRSVTGRYKVDAEGTSRAFLIAQDVQAVLPEAVTKTHILDDETEYLGVGYTDVIPLLVAAIKELKAEIDALKANR
jgi:hypothetical protein